MPSNIVHIHPISLDAPHEVLSKCLAVVDQQEKSRAERFTRSELSRRWLIARAGLRNVLASYVDAGPRELQFSAERFGKPVLAGQTASTGVHFNLTHSGSLAVVAVTRAAPIGVDIEHERIIPDWEQVARRFFSARENSQLTRISPAYRQRAFYCCWTRKEAVIKATGEGLTAKLDGFDVSVDPEVKPQVVRFPGSAENTHSWFLHHFEPARDYVGAVALRSGSPVSVQLHHDVSWASE